MNKATGFATFEPADHLKLQQLRLREWIGESEAESDPQDSTVNGKVLSATRNLPSKWKMTGDLKLHQWQQSACEAWFANDHQGTIKVVTGAGKTVVAMAIIERLQRSDPELRVVIVVPTIVLMNQWCQSIQELSNLPNSAVGRLGDGHSDTFNSTTRILVAVLASAQTKLPSLVSPELSKHLLLVGDECHNIGAQKAKRVLDTARKYSLGLSATPERSDEITTNEVAETNTPAGQGLSPIVYEMSFAQAIDLDVLPPFRVEHFGLPLTESEGKKYLNLTNSINEAQRELRNASTKARNKGADNNFFAWAQRESNRDSTIAPIAARYVSDTNKRKQLLYKATSRTEATVSLVRDALATREDARVIIFHESISEVTKLFTRLESERLPAVMEHSELPKELRNKSLGLFRDGIANIVVSAKSLIEGFNVPESDFGIIAASSSSPRQRIQSIGRVLRRHRDTTGEEKESRIIILYVRDTNDENIYETKDWDEAIGSDRNTYYTWDPPDKPIKQDEPPRAAIPTEDDIDSNNLQFGDEWPGRYAGEEFSCDSLGNVVSDNQFANNPQEIPDRVHQLKGTWGRFKVTPRKQVVLVNIPKGDRKWVTQFAGHLTEPFDFTSPTAPVSSSTDDLQPGDRYDGPLEPAQALKFQKRQNGVIARPRKGGLDFANSEQAAQLVTVLREINRTRNQIGKFFVNELGHAFWREQGKAFFISDNAGNLFGDKDTQS